MMAQLNKIISHKTGKLSEKISLYNKTIYLYCIITLNENIILYIVIFSIRE